MKCTINLHQFGSLGLILCNPSGVFYTNQARGLACAHPEVEGVFVPFPEESPDNPRPLVCRIAEHFRGGWYHILVSDADFTDAELRSRGFGFLTVDRERLNDSFEAWVTMRVTDDSTSGFLSGFSGLAAILTWPNSD